MNTRILSKVCVGVLSLTLFCKPAFSGIFFKYNHDAVLEGTAEIYRLYAGVLEQRKKVFNENGDHPVLPKYELSYTISEIDAATAKKVSVRQAISFSELPGFLDNKFKLQASIPGSIAELESSIAIEGADFEIADGITYGLALKKFQDAQKRVEKELTRLTVGPQSELIRALKFFANQAEDKKALDLVTNYEIFELMKKGDEVSALSLIELTEAHPQDCQTGFFSKFKKPVHTALTKPNNIGQTILMYASEAGYTKIVNALIKKQVPLDAVDYQGNSALHYAAKAGNEEVEAQLLKNHPDLIHIRNRQNENLYSIKLNQSETSRSHSSSSNSSNSSGYESSSMDLNEPSVIKDEQ